MPLEKIKQTLELAQTHASKGDLVICEDQVKRALNLLKKCEESEKIVKILEYTNNAFSTLLISKVNPTEKVKLVKKNLKVAITSCDSVEFKNDLKMLTHQSPGLLRPIHDDLLEQEYENMFGSSGDHYSFSTDFFSKPLAASSLAAKNTTSSCNTVLNLVQQRNFSSGLNFSKSVPLTITTPITISTLIQAVVVLKLCFLLQREKFDDISEFIHHPLFDHSVLFKQLKELLTSPGSFRDSNLANKKNLIKAYLETYKDALVAYIKKIKLATDSEILIEKLVTQPVNQKLSTSGSLSIGLGNSFTTSPFLNIELTDSQESDAKAILEKWLKDMSMSSENNLSNSNPGENFDLIEQLSLSSDKSEEQGFFKMDEELDTGYMNDSEDYPKIDITIKKINTDSFSRVDKLIADNSDDDYIYKKNNHISLDISSLETDLDTLLAVIIPNLKQNFPVFK